MTITIPDFTVETAAGGRIQVSWADVDASYYFLADVDGDEIKSVRPSTYHRYPVIYRSANNKSRRSGLSYLSAASPEFAPLVEAFKQAVRDGKLATKAKADAAAAQAERNAQRIRDKANKVRELLARHTVFNIETTHDVADETLAAFYDDVQNAAI